jgi:hypothetical protein
MPRLEPVIILETRLYKKAGMSLPQVWVQWRGQPALLAMWEDQAELLHHFPDAPAWGQAGSQPGESVTYRDLGSTVATPTPATSPTPRPAEQKMLGPQRGDRIRRPNPRYATSPGPPECRVSDLKP